LRLRAWQVLACLLSGVYRCYHSLLTGPEREAGETMTMTQPVEIPPSGWRIRGGIGFFMRAAPKARVSRMRYRIGLVIWALLAVSGLFIFYMPDLIPGYNENRLIMNLAADFLFLASFFVLGGDFRDKFRALFIYEARAVIPG
jgi:hypothetical protein